MSKSYLDGWKRASQGVETVCTKALGQRERGVLEEEKTD